MSCYICLEDTAPLMTTKGCACKGSISIHRACLQEWLATAENPFQCAVCKTDYEGTFLNTFLSAEDILFCPTKGEEMEEEDESEMATMFDFHGITILEVGDELIFKNEEHRTIYNQTNAKEDRAIKLEARHYQKQASRMMAKPRQFKQRTMFCRLK